MPGADLPPVNSIATDDDEELVNAFILSLVNRYSPRISLSQITLDPYASQVCPLGSAL